MQGISKPFNHQLFYAGEKLSSLRRRPHLYVECLQLGEDIGLGSFTIASKQPFELFLSQHIGEHLVLGVMCKPRDHIRAVYDWFEDVQIFIKLLPDELFFGLGA